MPFDKSQLRECPTLYPTFEEFDDPILYMSREDIRALGAKNGILKIVPPAPWKPPFSLSPSFKFHTRIQKLSDLSITARSRKLFMDNLNRYLKMFNKATVNEWLLIRSVKVHCYDLYVAVSKAAPEATATGQIPPEAMGNINLMFHLSPHSSFLHREYCRKILPYAKYLSINGDNFDFPTGDPGDTDSCVVCKKDHSPTTTLLCDNCDDLFHMRCLRPPLEEVPKGTWYCEKCLVGTGEYGFEENSDVKYTLQGFFDHCQDFERQFSASFGKPGQRLSLDEIEQVFWSLVEEESSQIKVMYGADIHHLIPGEITGFPTSEYTNPGLQAAESQPSMPGSKTLHEKYANHPWNLTRLPFANGSLLNHINTGISGMTVPWIYVGSLLSTFCWHVEDHYTLSANYCHFGDTKKWYGIPSLYADQFEIYLRSLAPDLFQRQPDLLHQLVTLISPAKLAKIGIPCFYADQNPNEFVVTFPRVYHAGFNSGFNVNEAVNFTMDSWLDFGEKSVQDYKLIKKENVFDHYNLIENILRSFSADPVGHWSHRADIIGKCIRNFESFIERQMSSVKKLEGENLVKVVLSRKTHNSTPVRPVEMSFLLRPKASSKKSLFGSHDDDDNLCDICRVAISHQYCEINNRNRRFGRWYNGRPKLNPEVLPVNKLLTPEPLPPYMAKNEHGPYGAAEVLAMSHATETLEILQARSDDERKRNLSDQIQERIRDAKGKPTDGDDESSDFKAVYERNVHSVKRRYLRKSEAKKVMPQVVDTNLERVLSSKRSQMKKVQYSSLLHQLNQLDSIKLCLECTVILCGNQRERVPKGSQILFRREFADMKQLLHEAKQRFYSMIA